MNKGAGGQQRFGSRDSYWKRGLKPFISHPRGHQPGARRAGLDVKVTININYTLATKGKPAEPKPKA